MTTSRLGTYQLLEPLRSGAVAELFLARAPAPPEGDATKLVVIKRLVRAIVDNPRAGHLPDRAREIQGFTHPHLVTVLEVGRDGDQAWIASADAPGASLRELLDAFLARGESMPAPLAAQVMAQVCAGLSAVHASGAGRVHGAVSARSILLGLDGAVRLDDYGFSPVAGTPFDSVQSERLGFLSPEQILGEALDGRSDVFAVGLVLFELLTGLRLYGGTNTAATLQMVLDAQVPPLRSLNPALPEALDIAVLKALARAPGDRFQTADELGKALAGFAEHDAPSISDALDRELPGVRTSETALRRRLSKGASPSMSSTPVSPSSSASTTPPPGEPNATDVVSSDEVVDAGAAGKKTRKASTRKAKSKKATAESAVEVEPAAQDDGGNAGDEAESLEADAASAADADARPGGDDMAQEAASMPQQEATLSANDTASSVDAAATMDASGEVAPTDAGVDSPKAHALAMASEPAVEPAAEASSASGVGVAESPAAASDGADDQAATVAPSANAGDSAAPAGAPVVEDLAAKKSEPSASEAASATSETAPASTATDVAASAGEITAATTTADEADANASPSSTASAPVPTAKSSTGDVAADLAKASVEAEPPTNTVEIPAKEAEALAGAIAAPQAAPPAAPIAAAPVSSEVAVRPAIAATEAAPAAPMAPLGGVTSSASPASAQKAEALSKPVTGATPTALPATPVSPAKDVPAAAAPPAAAAVPSRSPKAVDGPAATPAVSELLGTQTDSDRASPIAPVAQVPVATSSSPSQVPPPASVPAPAVITATSEVNLPRYRAEEEDDDEDEEERTQIINTAIITASHPAIPSEPAPRIDPPVPPRVAEPGPRRTGVALRPASGNTNAGVAPRTGGTHAGAAPRPGGTNPGVAARTGGTNPGVAARTGGTNAGVAPRTGGTHAGAAPRPGTNSGAAGAPQRALSPRPDTNPALRTPQLGTPRAPQPRPPSTPGQPAAAQGGTPPRAGSEADLFAPQPRRTSSRNAIPAVAGQTPTRRPNTRSGETPVGAKPTGRPGSNPGVSRKSLQGEARPGTGTPIARTFSASHPAFDAVQLAAATAQETASRAKGVQPAVEILASNDAPIRSSAAEAIRAEPLSEPPRPVEAEEKRPTVVPVRSATKDPVSTPVPKGLYYLAGVMALFLMLGLGLILRNPSEAVVVIDVTPSESTTITVGGRQVKSGEKVSFPPGEYELVASAKGYQRYTQRITVFEGAPKSTYPIALEVEAPAEVAPVIPTPTGVKFTLQFTSATPEVEVWVDGVSVGITPNASVSLDVGRSYRYEARAKGYEAVEGIVGSYGASTLAIPLTMRKAGDRSAPMGRGKLVLSTVPNGAEIHLNGVPTGRFTPVTAAQPIEVPAGRHVLLFRLGETESRPQRVTLGDGQAIMLDGVALEPAP